MTARIDAKYPNRLRREFNRLRDEVDGIDLTSVTGDVSFNYLKYDITGNVTENLADPTGEGEVVMRVLHSVSGGLYTFKLDFDAYGLQMDLTHVDYLELTMAGGFVILISIEESSAWRWQALLGRSISYTA